MAGNWSPEIFGQIVRRGFLRDADRKFRLLGEFPSDCGKYSLNVVGPRNPDSQNVTHLIDSQVSATTVVAVKKYSNGFRFLSI